ncbi:MAG: sodium:calcium antiporter [Bacteroidetes bacterium]|nr:MAG: sodium:calcium antiporter [Bacteroidota bacterium]
MLQALLLIAGLILLVYGASLLVDSASALAKTFHVPDIVIGLTIVAFGTSAPELLVNVYAAIEQSSAIALGNVAGSNLFNVMLILGISAAFYPITVKSSTTWTEIPLALLSALVFLVMANDAFLDPGTSSLISRADGIVLLLFFAIFIAYNIHLAIKGDTSEIPTVKIMSKWKSTLLLLVGLAMLIAGGRMMVGAAIQMAEFWGMSERLIALTIISVGTSLPELATSIVAAFKKNTDIAIGNVVGSNIFNVFLVLGTTAVISPVTIPAGANIDLLLNVIVSFMLFAFIFTGKGRRIDRAEGIIFLAMYIAYIVYIAVY